MSRKLYNSHYKFVYSALGDGKILVFILSAFGEKVRIGSVTTLKDRSRDEQAYFYKGSGWYTGFVGGHHEFLKDGGAGSQYALLNVDKNGEYMDGSKTYKLNIPANVPAKDFWSIVAYDPQTRSQLQTDQPFPGRNNQRNELHFNADGSVDLYFPPKPPEDNEANWIQTVPGKGWFIALRLYGPLESWFDKTWQPGEIERVE